MYSLCMQDFLFNYPAVTIKKDAFHPESVLFY